MTPTAALMTGVLTGALLGAGLMCLLMAGNGRGWRE